MIGTYPAKRAEVTSVLSGRTVGELGRELREHLGRAIDLLLVPSKDVDRLLLRACNCRLVGRDTVRETGSHQCR